MMSINSIQKALPTPPSSPIAVGKHKLPRYLYHFTNTKSALDIFESGAIKTSPKDEAFEKPAVFMVDMNNFLKYWKKFDVNNREFSMMRRLLTFAHKGQGELTCYKIPTDKLDCTDLKIRSVDRVFLDRSNNLEHFKCGDLASNKNLYNQRKEALEYIYTKDIPLKDTVQIGSAKIDPDEMLFEYEEQQFDALMVLEKLFKGRPESKGAKAQLDKYM